MAVYTILSLKAQIYNCGGIVEKLNSKAAILLPLLVSGLLQVVK